MSFDENISADRRVARNFDTGAISRNGTVRRRRFGAAISAMECETYFPLECHQSAKVSIAVMKHVGARFGLTLAPIVQQ